MAAKPDREPDRADGNTTAAAAAGAVPGRGRARLGSRVRAWVAPPQFADDDVRTRRAILLNSMLLATAGLVLLIIAGNFMGTPVPVWVTAIDVGFIALSLWLRQWTRRGRVALVSAILLVGGAIAVTASLALLGTVRAPAAGVYMLLVITGGLLFEVPGLVVATVVCSTAVGGLIVAENCGWLPPARYEDTATQWLTHTVLAAWAGILTRSALQATRQALATAREEIHRRESVEARLRATLAEREVLVREVHHRVKNNLASVCALIDLQRDILAGSADAQAWHELRGRVSAMAMVHEQLYRSTHVGQVKMHDYLAALAAQLATAYSMPPDVSVQVDAGAIQLGLDSAIPCGLIANELLTNAVKYAFPPGTTPAGGGPQTIAITMTMADGQCCLGVSDNGVGLPGEPDWRGTATLGLRLVMAVARSELRGQLTVDTTPRTTFTVRFPYPPPEDHGRGSNPCR